jgi:Ser/Thr protein kinase RdoA (MazF antagonist)
MSNKKRWLSAELQENMFKKFKENYVPQFKNPVVRNGVRAVKANLGTLYPAFNDKTPQCMVHGDFHHWNNMTRKVGTTEEVEVVLLDWQMWGHGTAAREIAYFMNLSIDVDYDRDMKLLRFYHAQLVARGVTNYSYEKFFYDWVIAQIEWNAKVTADVS